MSVTKLEKGDEELEKETTFFFSPFLFLLQDRTPWTQRCPSAPGWGSLGNGAWSCKDQLCVCRWSCSRWVTPLDALDGEASESDL